MHEFVVLAPGIAFRINLLKGYIYVTLPQINGIKRLYQCIRITEIPAKRLPLPINDYSCFEHLPGSEQHSNSLLNLFCVNQSTVHSSTTSPHALMRGAGLFISPLFLSLFISLFSCAPPAASLGASSAASLGASWGDRMSL